MNLTVKNIIRETDDFKTFVFEEQLAYQSGQFLTFEHNNTRRSYSLVSCPQLEEPLAVGVKRIPNGFFSRYLFDNIREGSKLKTIGAAGFFKLPGDIDHYRKAVFFAAGSGVTPVVSMIKTILYFHPAVQVLLIYSNRSVETTVYYHQLKVLEKQFLHRISIRFLFSSSVDLMRARLNRDLLFEYLYAEKIDVQQSIFYTCGPFAYMRMVIFYLEEFGVDAKKVRKEDFVPVPQTGHWNAPPDTSTYFVTILYNSKQYKIRVTYPDSILLAAKKEHILLPYSCENARCGSCAAVCKTGTVWMSNNEVLTEDDLARGLVLTCTSHPVNGDVELQIG